MKRENILNLALMVIIGVLVVVGTVQAATTISTDIVTEGALSVSGVSTLSTTTATDLTVSGRGRFTGTAGSTLTGTADPTANKTLIGSNTLFTTELIIGDRITINAETRTVTSITSNTSLTVDTAFTDTAAAAITKLPAIFVIKSSDNTLGMLMNDAGNVVIGNHLPEVGTIVPTSKFYVVNDSASSYTGVFESDSDSASGAYLSLRHARGTPTNPTAVLNGDSNYIYGGFYDGSRFWNGGQIAFVVDGTVVSGSRPPTSLAFYTNSGISINERMRIGPTGNVGIGETVPGSKLSVSGAGSFGASYDTIAAPTNGLIVEGIVGIGTSTPTTQLQVTTGSSNATSTLTVGKVGQNKGTCLELFDSAGTPVYAYVAAGATTFTLSSASCK